MALSPHVRQLRVACALPLFADFARGGRYPVLVEKIGCALALRDEGGFRATSRVDKSSADTAAPPSECARAQQIVSMLAVVPAAVE